MRRAVEVVSNGSLNANVDLDTVVGNDGFACSTPAVFEMDDASIFERAEHVIVIHQRAILVCGTLDRTVLTVDGTEVTEALFAALGEIDTLPRV